MQPSRAVSSPEEGAPPTLDSAVLLAYFLGLRDELEELGRARLGERGVQPSSRSRCPPMSRTSALLVCAFALFGCGDDSPPPSNPDAGTPLSCPASEKPLGTSFLEDTSPAQVYHPPGPLQVGQTVSFEVPKN